MQAQGETDVLEGLHPRFRMLDGLRFWPVPFGTGDGPALQAMRRMVRDAYNPRPWTFRVGRYVNADGPPAVFVMDAHGQKVANLTVNLYEDGYPGELPPEAVHVCLHEAPLAEVLRGFLAFDVQPWKVHAGYVEEYAEVWCLNAWLDTSAFREECEARVQEELRRVAAKDAAERLGHRRRKS